MKTVIELTASARRKASESGVLERLGQLELDAFVVTGDFLEIAGDGEAVTFVVRSRFLRVDADNNHVLALELDHPPRRAIR